MAETKTTKAAAAKRTEEEKLEIFIPRGSQHDDPNLFVGVNNVDYILPRGKTSMVPKSVYKEIVRSQKAEEALYKKMDGMAIQPGK